MIKRISIVALILGISAIVYSASGTPSTLIVKTDSTGSLVVTSGTPTPPYKSTVFNNTLLKTDASGNLLVASSGGGGTPGGSDTQIQYNNAGAFGGVPGFTYGSSKIGIPDNNNAASAVAITKGGLLWMHNYSPVGAAGGNTFLGINSGNFTTGDSGASSSLNTAVGFETLKNLNEGYRNSVFGWQAGTSITNGHYNTCMGGLSCSGVITGTFNAFFGWSSGSQTLTSENSGFGQHALDGNTTGNRNTCMGSACLAGIDTGSENIGMGYISGRNITGGVLNNTTGTLGIYIGDASQAFANGLSYETVLGHATTGSGSYTFTVGNVKSAIQYSLSDAPTCGTNCGTSPTITGNNSSFTLTMGATGSPASGFVITFDTDGAFTSAPQCVGSMGKTGMVVGKLPLTIVTSTTVMTVVTNGTNPTNTDVYSFHCSLGR